MKIFTMDQKNIIAAIVIFLCVSTFVRGALPSLAFSVVLGIIIYFLQSFFSK